MGLPLFAPRRPLPDGGVSLPTNTKMPKVIGTGADHYARGREVGALLLGTIALFLLLALGSYAGDATPPADGTPATVGANWVGPVGEAAAMGLVSLIGVVAWAVPVELLLLGLPFLTNKKSTLTTARIASNVGIACLLAALVQIGWPQAKAFGNHTAAGALGELFGELGRSLFSTVGSLLVGFALLSLVCIGRSTFSFIALMRLFGLLGSKSAETTARGAQSIADAWRKAREIDEANREAARPHIELTPAIAGATASGGAPNLHGATATGGAPNLAGAVAAKLEAVRTASPPSEARAVTKAPPVVAESPALDTFAADDDDEGETRPLAPVNSSVPQISINVQSAADPEPKGKRGRQARPRNADPIADALADHDFGAAAPEASARPGPEQAVAARASTKKPAAEPTKPVVDTVSASVRTAGANAPGTTEQTEPVTPSVPVQSAGKSVTEPKASSGRTLGKMPPAPATPVVLASDSTEGGAIEPVIIDTTAALEMQIPEESPPPVVVHLGKEFVLPSIDFLSVQKSDPTALLDKDVLYKNADLLVKTLSDYGVSGKVEEILPGPTVTTYEVSPAAGTKVSKVAGLADDLALALAKKVRIVAPIPGKNRIGFELPNEKRQPVSLRELVEDKRFQEYDVPLPVVIGRDIVGNPVFADLASMPHVIVAGATGAGKSVGLNVMLTSLLYRRTPDDLRLLMIDPKVVELAPFDRIPHMLLPVVTDMKQAANALKWAVDEMERRYQAFADAGTKNIGTYNGWVARVARGEVKNPNAKVVSTKDHNGFEEFVKDDVEGVAPLPEKLPYIVIVVDEFADLMMQQGKEVEAAVARLAQKARAAGMHVILATQRPSVDVITGMIKANFPTRIAFRVAQKVDSRTILDEQGAEHLLGRGDLLMRLNGTNDTRRVQCPWISEEEVDLVTNHLRKQGEPIYDENILKPRDEDGAAVEEDAEQDAMYDDALRIVADTRRCSTSWLQRKLGLGYNRAARIVEMMEKRGIVGPANGSKDREVLIASL